MGDEPRDAEQLGASALTEGVASDRAEVVVRAVIQPDDLARQVRAWWRYACPRARRLSRRGGWIFAVWGAAIAAFGGAQGVWFEVEAGAALAVVGLFSAVDRFVLGSTVRRSKAAFDQTGKEFVLAVDDMGVSWATDLVSWRFAWPITRLVEAGDQVLFTTKSDGMIGVSRSLLDDDQLATLRTIAESHRGEYLSEADRRQATAEVITPGWYPDPTGRHEERFRDSQGWRQSVRDGGVQGRDRL